MADPPHDGAGGGRVSIPRVPLPGQSGSCGRIIPGLGRANVGPDDDDADEALEEALEASDVVPPPSSQPTLIPGKTVVPDPARTGTRTLAGEDTPEGPNGAPGHGAPQPAPATKTESILTATTTGARSRVGRRPSQQAARPGGRASSTPTIPAAGGAPQTETRAETESETRAETRAETESETQAERPALPIVPLPGGGLPRAARARVIPGRTPTPSGRLPSIPLPGGATPSGAFPPVSIGASPGVAGPSGAYPTVDPGSSPSGAYAAVAPPSARVVEHIDTPRTGSTVVEPGTDPSRPVPMPAGGLMPNTGMHPAPVDQPTTAEPVPSSITPIPEPAASGVVGRAAISAPDFVVSDTGQAPHGSIDLGTDVARAVGSRRGGAWWAALAGSMVAVALLGVGVASATRSEPPPAAMPASEAAESETDTPQPVPDVLWKLARVNELDDVRASGFDERHALLDELAATAYAGRIDVQRNLALDLLQAGQAASPCTVIDASLTRIELSPNAYFITPLRRMTMPTGEDCEGLEARRQAMLAQLRGDDVVEPVEPEPVAKPRGSRGRKRGGKSGKSGKSTWGASSSKSDGSKTSGSKPGGLKPFGG